MSQFPKQMDYAQSWATAGTSNPAISRFFNAVYAWMCAGLAVTAVVAWFVSRSPQLMASFYHSWVILLVVEVVLVMVISRAVNKINTTMATLLFLAYAAINGLTFSVIFFIYAHAALASAFVVTAGMFGALSLYGFFTKRDLSAIGRFLYMALIGLVIAGVVSIFYHNSAFQVLFNFLGVFIFAGLTAYDTQKLKVIAEQTQDNPALANRMSIVGSLVLYLDFINLFLFIVELMNDKRR